MTDQTSPLSFESLFGSSPRNPDGLIHRWLGGPLAPASEEAVFVHLLGSTYDRDEAMVQAIMREGSIRSAAAARSPVARVRVAIRRLGDLLEVLGDSLPALEVTAVPVRTGAVPALSGCSFEVGALGAGRRLHVGPAAGGRFSVSVDAGPDDADAEWVLKDDDGRLVMGDVGDEAVVFTSVGPGDWSLERRSGEDVLAAVDLALHVGEDG